jgi:NAD(P)-dependent dehydrogenase (short-subunit alcohol dehydrogenase family)
VLGKSSEEVCLVAWTGGSVGRATAFAFVREGGLVVGCGPNVEAESTRHLTTAACGGPVGRLRDLKTRRGDLEEVLALQEPAVLGFGNRPCRRRHLRTSRRLNGRTSNGASASHTWVESDEHADSIDPATGGSHDDACGGLLPESGSL